MISVLLMLALVFGTILISPVNDTLSHLLLMAVGLVIIGYWAGNGIADVFRQRKLALFQDQAIGEDQP